MVGSSDKETKKFLNPITTAAVGALGWFVLKAVAQAVIGWIALKWVQRNTNRKGKKDDEGSSEEISIEESAAAS